MAKEWAWSYTKLKNFDTCPLRHYEVDILKNYTEESEQLIWGGQVHEALANACSGKAPLPATMKDYQKWVDEMVSGPGELFVEQKYAITRKFEKAAYFGHNVWYRGICDVLRIDGPVALARDWKTGAIKHNSVQLMLMAQCIFVHYPEVQKIKTEFVWLQDDCVTPELWSRDTIYREWVSLLPQVDVMEQASKTKNYPPKPSGLCRKWCPVKTCEHHGKGRRD